MLWLKYQKIINLFILLLLAGFFLFSITPLTADASGIVPCGRTVNDPSTPDINEANPCTLCHLFIGIHRIIEWGFKILTFVAIASLVAAGIIYIVSTGSEKLMETAKNFAKHTLMGFAIVLGAWLIVNYSMILLSKKSDLGLGIKKWNEFECDTRSDLGAPSKGEEGSDSPITKWICVSEGKCRVDSHGSYDSEEECINSPTCKDDCGDYHTSCTNRPCCEPDKYKCVQHPGLALDKKWCVGEEEYCGVNDAGFCYDGNFILPCPTGASLLLGGRDCSTGEYCCIYSDQ